MELELQQAPMLASLVELYGIAATWRAAWKALSYPPSFVHTLAEAREVAKVLEGTA